MGTLLVVADREGKCTATERGLALASKLELNVEIVAFVHAPLKRLAKTRAEQDAIKRRLLDAREKELKQQIEEHSAPGQSAALKVVWKKDIHDWIERRARAKKFAAVIKTTHNSGNFGYTSTDWHLLRECPAPILLTAEKRWHRTKPVLAALDLGTRSKTKRALNDAVITRAKALAEALGVELKLIGAIEVPTLLADLDIVDPASYAKEQREAMLPYIKSLAEKHDLPEKAFRTKRGPVAKIITSEAAKARAQIVVMGTVGRQGLKARLIGNTAESVLQHLNTDVLAVKP
jgi:universal stress protein E